MVENEKRSVINDFVDRLCYQPILCYEDMDNAQVEEHLRIKKAEFERDVQMARLMFPYSTFSEFARELINRSNWDCRIFCDKTLLDQNFFYNIMNNHASSPTVRSIAALACGLDLDLQTTNTLLRLAGRAFNGTEEHRALQACITGYRGHLIEDRNMFLKECGFKPLGSK